MNNDKAYYIYVDSALRTSGTNSDFTFQTTQNNFIASKAKVALQSFTLTNAIYQINNTNDVLNYSVTTAGPTTNFYTLTIADGNYTVSELITTIRSNMNTQTASNNTSIPLPVYSNITNKISWRKNNIGDPVGEVSATYNFLSTSTIKGVLGFESTFSFGNALVEMPNMVNLRPMDYFYLTSPNVQSSSFVPNIGGNGILGRIRILSSRNSTQFSDNDNMFENLVTCSYIPLQWSFKLVDKYGQAVNLQLPFSFTLRVFPE